MPGGWGRPHPSWARPGAPEQEGASLEAGEEARLEKVPGHPGAGPAWRSPCPWACSLEAVVGHTGTSHVEISPPVPSHLVHTQCSGKSEGGDAWASHQGHLVTTTTACPTCQHQGQYQPPIWSHLWAAILGG